MKDKFTKEHLKHIEALKIKYPKSAIYAAYNKEGKFRFGPTKTHKITQNLMNKGYRTFVFFRKEE